MKEYIERAAALDVVKRTSGDYVAAWSEIAHIPAADVAEVRHGSASMAKRVKFPLTVTENPLFVNART